jgi:phosphoserine phosphatase RsbU/P
VNPHDGSISAGQLKQLLDISRMLAVTADLDQLLHCIAQAATQMLICERASIFLFDPRTDQLWTKVALHSQEIRVPSGAGIVGHTFKTNVVLHVPQPYDDPRFNPDPDRRSGFVTRNLLTAPMVDMDRNPVGVIQAVNKANGAFEAADAAMIQLLADQAGVAIQRYNLQQSAIEAVALRREMDLAKLVQEALLPDAPPDLRGLDAVGWNMPASITGGDCYDLWKTSDGRLGIFLGDATGHGIGPAMVISQTRTLVRAMCEINPDPHDLLTCANARLADDLEAGQFVTAFVGFLSPDGMLHWSSAGHSPVIVRLSPGRALKMLLPTGPPLGVLDTFEADRVPPLRLGVGGMLLVASDGINEAFSSAREEFGVDRLCRIIDACRHEPPSELLRCMRRAVRKWQGGDDPRDDQSVVIVRRTAAPTEPVPKRLARSRHKQREGRAVTSRRKR